MRGSRRIMGAAGAAALALAIAACGASGGHSFTAPTSTPTAVQKAMTPDQAANAVLQAAGYTTSKDVPEFGKYAAGINLTASARYMVVVTVKSAQDATAVKTYYDQHPQTGVTVSVGTSNGVNYVAFKINTLKDGKDALENIGKALRTSAQGSL